MDFTRQPIIESVITPKEGCKLVVRSSKGIGQEEYFVDALEIVSFGGTFFLRSTERPKSFLLPATDYEVLEVREPRMVLKSAGLDRTAKQEPRQQQQQQQQQQSQKKKENPPAATPEEKGSDRKRDRRRNQRKRRDREEGMPQEEMEQGQSEPTSDEYDAEVPAIPSTAIKAIIPPPTTLISETIARYRGDDLFKGVFFPEEEVSKPATSSEQENFAEEIPSLHGDEKTTVADNDENGYSF